VLMLASAATGVWEPGLDQWTSESPKRALI